MHGIAHRVKPMPRMNHRPLERRRNKKSHEAHMDRPWRSRPSWPFFNPNNRLNSRGGCLLGTSCPFSTHCRPECQSLIHARHEMRLFLHILQVLRPAAARRLPAQLKPEKSDGCMEACVCTPPKQARSLTPRLGKTDSRPPGEAHRARQRFPSGKIRRAGKDPDPVALRLIIEKKRAPREGLPAQKHHAD